MSFDTARMAELYTEAEINIEFRASDTREPDEDELVLMEFIEKMVDHRLKKDADCPLYQEFQLAVKALKLNGWWVTLGDDWVKFKPWKWASFTRENVESDLDGGSGWVLMRRCDNEDSTTK